MMNTDLFDEYLKRLSDHFTAAELVEEMGLDVWDVIEAFRDHLETFPIDLDKYRFPKE